MARKVIIGRAQRRAKPDVFTLTMFLAEFSPQVSLLAFDAFLGRVAM
jgi:hypothetical protein